MSETRFHGARVTENTDLVTAINDVDSSVIGIVATADDADAKLFPLNKPTLLTRVNDVLGKCGTTGTLYRALKAIADQVSTKVIVVRVAEHKEEDEKTQDQLVIGGSEDDGSYTGMYALLVAELDESIGYRPRILAAPELDTEAVTKSLCVIAGKLRAFVYASCHGCNTMAEAITYLVLKMLQIMRAGRWEYDRAERELVAAFNAVRKVKTPGGFITYETDRARGISHGDLAWATMLAVINEPIGGEGENERFTVMEF